MSDKVVINGEWVSEEEAASMLDADPNLVYYDNMNEYYAATIDPQIANYNLRRPDGRARASDYDKLYKPDLARDVGELAASTFLPRTGDNIDLLEEVPWHRWALDAGADLAELAAGGLIYKTPKFLAAAGNKVLPILKLPQKLEALERRFPKSMAMAKGGTAFAGAMGTGMMLDDITGRTPLFRDMTDVLAGFPLGAVLGRIMAQPIAKSNKDEMLRNVYRTIVKKPKEMSTFAKDLAENGIENEEQFIKAAYKHNIDEYVNNLESSQSASPAESAAQVRDKRSSKIYNDDFMELEEIPITLPTWGNEGNLLNHAYTYDRTPFVNAFVNDGFGTDVELGKLWDAVRAMPEPEIQALMNITNRKQLREAQMKYDKDHANRLDKQKINESPFIILKSIKDQMNETVANAFNTANPADARTRYQLAQLRKGLQESGQNYGFSRAMGEIGVDSKPFNDLKKGMAQPNMVIPAMGAYNLYNAPGVMQSAKNIIGELKDKAMGQINERLK